MPVNPNDERADAAIEKATSAFWHELAVAYPEITSGDMTPAAAVEFNEVAAAAAREWIRANGRDIVFSHDQLAKLAGHVSGASIGNYGDHNKGTCWEVHARQGTPSDWRRFGGTWDTPLPIDTRDMVIEVRWIDARSDNRVTMILVRPDGASIAYDQP